jgi:hypothetical protein
MISSFRLCRKLLVLSVLLAGSSLPWARAADIGPQSELNPLPTFEPVHLPNPLDVPGKEYSNALDKNAAGNPDPGQVVRWQGDGTSVWDSIDYQLDGGGGGGGGGRLDIETDAIANIRGKYFFDLDGTRPEFENPQDHLKYRGDTVSLVVSLHKSADYNGDDVGYQNNIYASRSSFRGGAKELWADWHKNINANLNATDDLDGLELYGPEQTSDANMYSRKGDPNTDESGRVSVYRFYPDRPDPQTALPGLSVPYLRTEMLLDAVITDDGTKPDWGKHNPNDFDVDAMKIWDVADDDHFGEGDEILFSIRPIDGLFDGGEIWLYKFGDSTAQFLVQGLMEDGITPRTWNKANEVSQFFFGDDAHGEDIDALEALAPEPSSLTLLVLGGLTGVAFVLRRRRR